MRKERVSRRENGKDISSICTELNLSPGGNGNPAQYNTEDNKNICEAVILTRKQVGFFVLHIYSVMKYAKRCTF